MIHQRCSHLAFAIALLLAMPTSAQDKDIKVTVLLYSGRPNPTYFIEAKPSLDYLKARVTKKQIHFTGKTVLPSGLGYGGILVENVGNVAGLPGRFTVYNGKSEADERGKKVYADKDRSVEAFLLKEAVKQKAIDEDMAKHLNPKIAFPNKVQPK